MALAEDVAFADEVPCFSCDGRGIGIKGFVAVGCGVADFIDVFQGFQRPAWRIFIALFVEAAELVVVRPVLGPICPQGDKGAFRDVAISGFIGFDVVDSDGVMKVVGEPKKLAGSAMAIDKGHEDELKAINQALADLKADGTYTKLYQKWFGVDPTAEELQ